MTITNLAGTISGMICDGAKPSCASKIASALSCGVIAHQMALNNIAFEEDTGIIKHDIEQTIDAVGKAEPGWNADHRSGHFKYDDQRLAFAIQCPGLNHRPLAEKTKPELPDEKKSRTIKERSANLMFPFSGKPRFILKRLIVKLKSYRRSGLQINAKTRKKSVCRQKA